MRQAVVVALVEPVQTELHGKVVKVAAARIMLFFLETLALAEQVVKTVLALAHPLGGIKADTVAVMGHKAQQQVVTPLQVLVQVAAAVDLAQMALAELAELVL